MAKRTQLLISICMAGLLLAGRVRAAEAAPALALADISPAAMASFAGPDPGRKAGPTVKLGLRLTRLMFEWREHRARQGRAGPPFRSADRLVRVAANRVVIDAVAAHDAQALHTDLLSLGLQDSAVFGRYVSGALPLEALEAAAALASLRLARPALAQRRAGVVTSQGDVALAADSARTTYGVDGTGSTVGTLSDSYDCLGDAATDVANGDLPVGVIVLDDYSGSDCSDEGRAMMQIITDLAPGAAQAFHTAFGGTAVFAQGILDLEAAGADIINDDIIYFGEPMFQDGPIAQAIDTVTAAGVAYFSAAGNEARDSYEAAFVDSGQTGRLAGSTRHDFDPGPAVDTLQQITVPANSDVIFLLQWSEPFFSVSGAPGSASDVDIIAYTELGGGQLRADYGGIDANIGGDPVELMQIPNTTGNDKTFHVAIELVAGPMPSLVKYIYFPSSFDFSIDEFDTQSPTAFGHPNAAGAAAVGAAGYDQTPAFGFDPPLLEPFSSAGGIPILFEIGGTPTFELRQKPEFVAADAVNTTFFGFDFDADGFPNFFGTSAAAPHAAAVAALLKSYDQSLTPAEIRTAMADTALDMAAAGDDFDSGSGLVQADLAIASLLPPPDADGDGQPDTADNCIDRPNGPTIPDAGGNSQLDTNGDGFGNVCDGDLNDDGIVNSLDLGLFKTVFLTADADADLNGDGLVNSLDLGLFKAQFLQPPGPSGIVP